MSRLSYVFLETAMHASTGNMKNQIKMDINILQTIKEHSPEKKNDETSIQVFVKDESPMP
jgi:hypothetical protein